MEASWKVAELVSVLKEFIFQVTAPDNVQIPSSDAEGFVSEVHLTANKTKQKKFKPTIPITSFLMIYGLPSEQGYATLHAFRCIISASWDLIKITASKIPVKWKFWEDNTLYILMQNVSIPSSGKIWVNLCFYGCRQKFTNFVFFDTLVVFYYVKRSFASKEGRKRIEWNTLHKMHLTLLSNIIIAQLWCHHIFIKSAHP